jgi:hypothetical protein
MKNEHDHGEWERRPAPGASARAGDFAAARRSFERHKAEHEARQRGRPRRGGLTIREARKRMRYGL